MKRIAVLLAAFNGELWIREQVCSILAQKDVLVTIFVSIDRSNDNTEEVLRKLSETDSRIVILWGDERFGGAAANFFRLIRDVDFSRFDYISFADQDDVWNVDKLSSAVEMISASGVDAYSSNVTAFWGNGREVLVDKSQQQCRWDFLFEAAGPGCTYVLKVEVVGKLRNLLITRRTEVRKVGLHDWFIYAFTRANGYKWIIDPRPSMAYRQHAVNQVGANVGWRAFQARMNRILGGWGITQARLIAQLSGLENECFCIPWARRGRVGMLWLAVNAYRCRRKVLDRFVFAGACLLLTIVGDRSDEPR